MLAFPRTPQISVTVTVVSVTSVAVVVVVVVKVCVLVGAVNCWELGLVSVWFGMC